MNIDHLLETSGQQTRVIICNVHPKITELISFVIHYLQKEIDLMTSNINKVDHNDFILIEESEEQNIQLLKPTILFVGSQNRSYNYINLFSTITPGGIAIYPEYNNDADKAVLQTSNFFRKINFQKPQLTKEGSKFSLVTEMGNIPTSFIEEFELTEIIGAQHFCQHIGIMEDEFYEALIAF